MAPSSKAATKLQKDVQVGPHAAPHVDVQEEEEEDFMSDKFIIQAENEQRNQRNPQSYSERRRKELAQSSAKARQKSRAQREEEARQEGLARDLLAGASKAGRHTDANDGHSPSAAGGNKALKMMLAMGYKPGQALGESSASGKDRNPDQKVEQDKASGGAAVPILLDSRWQGKKARHGIGSSEVVSRAILRAATEQAKREQNPQEIQDFRSRFSAEQAQKHNESLLSKARKTCEELDRRRLQMEYSPLWIDAKWMELGWDGQLDENAKEVLRLAFGTEVDGLTGKSLGGEVDGARLARQEERMRKAMVSETDTDAQEKNLDEAPLTSARAEEARKYCSLDVTTRLRITLDHLREAHFYCLFCGCQYDDAEDLQRSCPGEDEEDHE